MSKVLYHKLRLTFPNCTLCSDIWVDHLEYNEMINTLRGHLELTQYWLRDSKGVCYNMAHVQSFIEIEQKEE